MYKIPANTLFLGKSLVYVPQCHSTNTLASDLSQKPETPEGTMVVTDDQIAGRGQRGSTWVASPGMNLTVSVVLRPKFLSAKDQFQINQVVSLAVADFIRENTPQVPVTIKWPNDIMIGDQKTAGILIENHVSAAAISASIVGMGININQESFPWPKATSLKAATGTVFDLNDCLATLLGYLEVRYLALKQGRSSDLQEDYARQLYRRDEEHSFRSAQGDWNGTITGVDEVGRLRVKAAGRESVFGVKEIEFLPKG